MENTIADYFPLRQVAIGQQIGPAGRGRRHQQGHGTAQHNQAQRNSFDHRQGL